MIVGQTFGQHWATSFVTVLPQVFVNLALQVETYSYKKGEKQ